jgi:hypothetical protein
LNLLHLPVLRADVFVHEANFREGCRIRAGGMYLDVYDHMTEAREWMQLSQKKRATLEKAMQEAQKQLAKAQGAAAQSIYAEDKEQDRINFTEKVKNLQFEINEQDQLLSHAKKEEEESAKIEKIWRERLLKVFAFESYPKESLGYPFKLVFQEKCPKYRDTCPLSAQAKAYLREVFVGLEIPPICVQYLTM